MAQTITDRNKWVFGECTDIWSDKDILLRSTITTMLNKTTRMFRYKGLPDTITEKDLEIYNQVNGFSVWAEHEGKLYVFFAGLGGEPNAYYLPTKAVVSNPALRFNKTLTIGENCVVMLNDNFYQGLMPLNRKYGTLLVEAELSLKYAILNARVPALVQADNDTTKESAEEFFRKIYKGEEYGIIGTREFMDGIKSQDFYKQAYIKDLIEAIQYIKGSWYNELGLNSTFNMKREAINEAEARLNENILYPTIDMMLDCRRRALEKINKMFGTNITVELDSAWLLNRENDDLQQDLIKSEIESNEEQGGVEDVENDDIGNS